MTIGHFVWTDLSTYDIKIGRGDYSQFFGWQFSGDSAYDFARLGQQEVAALFPMPARLAVMSMPSFWMSYVRVENVDTAVSIARKHQGTVIEVEPLDFSQDARIALIRDPSGAGFTVYEGPDIRQGMRPDAQNMGMVIARYHHLSSVALIRDFYADLLSWRFEPCATKPWNTFNIKNQDAQIVAQAEEVPETIRGKYSYWMPCFSVSSVQQTADLIQQNQGACLNEFPDGRLMVADRQGAHFMVRDNWGL